MTAADRAEAQLPPWNREAGAIAAIPAGLLRSGSGCFDIFIDVEVQLNEPVSVPTDLSTEVLLFVGGTAVGTTTLAIGIDAGGGCGGTAVVAAAPEAPTAWPPPCSASRKGPVDASADRCR